MAFLRSEGHDGLTNLDIIGDQNLVPHIAAHRELTCNFWSRLMLPKMVRLAGVGFPSNPRSYRSGRRRSRTLHPVSRGETEH